MHSYKNAQIPYKIDQALYSTVKHQVSNDEIILKKKSDFGNGSHYVTCANTNGALQANPDTAEKSGESTDSDDDDFDGDDFNPDGACKNLRISVIFNPKNF